MRLPRNMLCAVGMAALLASIAGAARAADTPEHLQGIPLSDNPAIVNTALAPVKNGPLAIPTITWPGDMAAIQAQDNGTFKAEGLDTYLPTTNNDFVKAVQWTMEGNSPFVRGTWGMLNIAAEAFKKKGIDLVPIVQMTFSDGGDELVARAGINELADLKGKTIALQLYGPHIDFLTTLLARAGLKLSDVHLVWFRETSTPSYATNGKILDPFNGILNDKSIDAAFVIAPDGDTLTSHNRPGGGTGSDSSVAGMHKLVDSHMAATVIADEWAVRSDWLATHREQAQHFVHAIMLGQESFLDLYADKKARASDWDKLLTHSATLLNDSGAADSKQQLQDSIDGAKYVGFTGNVQFFTGAGTTRSFAPMANEVQSAFVEINMMHGPVELVNPNWDYSALAVGLKHADLKAVPQHQFDTKKIQTQLTTEAANHKAIGEGLTHFEVKFKPGLETFDSNYNDDFERLARTAMTFNNAIIAVEAYTDVYLLNQEEAKPRTESWPTEMDSFRRAAYNLSLKRAKAFKKAFLDYCASKGYDAIDESQLVPFARGATNPIVPNPATKKDGLPNMRAEIVVRDISVESSDK